MSGLIREYHRPKQWKAVQGLLRRNDVRAKPLFLSPHPMPPDKWPVDVIIDLTNLGIDAIEEREGYLKIGALASLQSIIDSSLVGKYFDGVINTCARRSGTPAIRNCANLGGVLTDLNSPGDLLPALLALDAEVILRNANNQTTTADLSLFLGMNRNPEPGEVVCGVQMPTGAKAFFAIESISRAPKDTSILIVVARLEITEGTIATARIAAGGASPRPCRMDSVEQLLMGQALTPQLMQSTANAAQGWAKPPSDFRGSAEYRRAMAGVIVNRAIQSAWKKSVGAAG